MIRRKNKTVWVAGSPAPVDDEQLARAEVRLLCMADNLNRAMEAAMPKYDFIVLPHKTKLDQFMPAHIRGRFHLLCNYAHRVKGIARQLGYEAPEYEIDFGDPRLVAGIPRIDIWLKPGGAFNRLSFIENERG